MVYGRKSKGLFAKDFAYKTIKEAIIEGKLQPNTPLIEEDLSSKLNISRTPLRSALERLQLEKLVFKQRNGRMKVAPISIREVKEIFMVRSKLEELAVYEATTKATEKDIQKLYDIAELIRQTKEKENIKDILYYGGKFHEYLYELSENKLIHHLLAQLNDHILRYRRLVPKQSLERMIQEGEEHFEIVHCIAEKDAYAAQLAIKRHIENSMITAIHAIKEYEENKSESIW